MTWICIKYKIRNAYYYLTTYPFELDFCDKVIFLGFSYICSYQEKTCENMVFGSPLEIRKKISEKYQNLIWVTYKFEIEKINDDIG